MIEVVRYEKGFDAEVLHPSERPSDWMRDWLIDQDQFIKRIKNTELLVDQLLHERDMLLKLVKVLRLWAYEMIRGNVTLIEKPIDLEFLEVIKTLPDHLQEEILKAD
jgi:hypothetical protein